MPNAEAFTNGRYWFRSADHTGRRVANPRRLNWFGRYSDHPGTGITVEINVAYEGHNAQAAGFFARDSDKGQIYLLHSGRVGGGTKGVGKNSFRAWSGEPLIEVSGSTGETRNGLIVMPIEGVAASQSAIRYVDSVARFKSAVRRGEINTPEFQQKQKQFEDFYAESRGRRKGRRSSKIDYLSRHGEIVDELFKWRKLSPLPDDARLVKNVLFDMGVAIGQHLLEVYEVKTAASRQNIYSALGQLLVHGSTVGCRRILALPQGEALDHDLVEAIIRLSVELLRFSLDRTRVKIIENHRRVKLKRA